MFRKSNLLATALLLAATQSSITPATAMPVVAVGEAALSLLAAARACPQGTHEGYLGKYCWPNRGAACPPGSHLGYEGKYCWRNR
jgi:hypothetical protein